MSIRRARRWSSADWRLGTAPRRRPARLRLRHWPATRACAAGRAAISPIASSRCRAGSPTCLAAPADRAVELSGPFREVDDVVIEVTLPTGHPLTAVVCVDNELGARAVDGVLSEQPMDEVLSQLEASATPILHARDISTADARARLAVACTGVSLADPPSTSTRWRTHRCLVRWMVSRLPDGGDATAPARQGDAGIDELATRFLASPWGRAWTRLPVRPLLDHVLESGLSNGLGDPLLWSPRHVGRLLDPELHGIAPDAGDLDRIPELLSDLIRYGHLERGLRPELTEPSLEAIDRWASAFIAAVRRWDDEATVGLPSLQPGSGADRRHRHDADDRT